MAACWEVLGAEHFNLKHEYSSFMLLQLVSST